jgi:hypothetical protein
MQLRLDHSLTPFAVPFLKRSVPLSSLPSGLRLLLPARPACSYLHRCRMLQVTPFLPCLSPLRCGSGPTIPGQGSQPSCSKAKRGPLLYCRRRVLFRLARVACSLPCMAGWPWRDHPHQSSQIAIGDAIAIPGQDPTGVSTPSPHLGNRSRVSSVSGSTASMGGLAFFPLCQLMRA